MDGNDRLPEGSEPTGYSLPADLSATQLTAAEMQSMLEADTPVDVELLVESEDTDKEALGTGVAACRIVTHEKTTVVRLLTDDTADHPKSSDKVSEDPEEVSTPKTSNDGSGDVPPDEGGPYGIEGGEDDERRDDHENERVGAAIATADSLLRALGYEQDLQGTRPTFKEIGSDVVIFYDKATSNKNDPSVVRTAFSVKDREQEISVDDLDPYSPWLSGPGQVQERSLGISDVMSALLTLSPEATIDESPIDINEEVPSEPRVVDATCLTCDPAAKPVRQQVEIRESVPLAKKNVAASEKKSLITAKVGDSDTPVSLIERGRALQYSDIWFACTAAGLLVPPEIYFTEDGKVLLTDIKADGSETYGKALKVTLEQGYERSRPQPEIDPLFIALMQEHGKEVEERARMYAYLASEHGILLDRVDPFELLVHPSGEWDVIALDLAEARSEVYDDPLLGHKNEVTTIRFLRGLKELASYLEESM